MSIDESLAARRRTICWRWPSASVGSFWYLIVYSPLLAALQASTAFCAAPELSG